jgi:hypothetical protein
MRKAIPQIGEGPTRKLLLATNNRRLAYGGISTLRSDGAALSVATLLAIQDQHRRPVDFYATVTHRGLMGHFCVEINTQGFKRAHF